MRAFVFAMRKEAESLLNELTIIKAFHQGYAEFYEAEKDGRSVLVVITGIGKAFASSALTSIALRYPDIEGVINLGVGGSLDRSKVAPFDIILSKRLVQYDMNTSGIGDPLGMVSGINKIFFEGNPFLLKEAEAVCSSLKRKAFFGTIGTGDLFVTNEKHKKRIADAFDVISVDMESASLAQIAYVYQIPFIAIRVVSDSGGQNEYEENLPEATVLLKEIATRLI